MKVARGLALVRRPIDCVVVLGRGFAHEESLAMALDGFPHKCAIVRDASVRAEMLAADLAVLSFGMTAYEGRAPPSACLADRDMRRRPQPC
jgi:hypothetical protein